MKLSYCCFVAGTNTGHGPSHPGDVQPSGQYLPVALYRLGIDCSKSNTHHVEADPIQTYRVQAHDSSLVLDVLLSRTAAGAKSQRVLAHGMGGQYLFFLIDGIESVFVFTELPKAKDWWRIKTAGLGKTTMAAAMARHEGVRRHFGQCLSHFCFC